MGVGLELDMSHLDKIISAFNLGTPIKRYGTEVRLAGKRTALYHLGKLLAFIDGDTVAWRAPSTRAEQRLVQRVTSAHRVTSTRAFWYGLRKSTTAALSQWNNENRVLEALK